MKAIVIEDQILFRDFLVAALSANFNLEVVGQYEDGEDGLEACLECEPDLVVLDLKLKGMGGMTVFNRIKDRLPETKVVLVSAYFSQDIVKKAVERGVNGLVSKDSSLECLKDAIGQILKGAVYFSPEAYELFRNAGTLQEDADTAKILDKLTRRETDVLQMVGEGYSSREIAKIFNLSARTIDAHRSNIMRKFHLRGATDMARLAVRLNLVSQG